LLLNTLVLTPFSLSRDRSASRYSSKGADFTGLLKKRINGLFSRTATVTAGHRLQGTIRAERSPAASETTSRSSKWIGILHSFFFCPLDSPRRVPSLSTALSDDNRSHDGEPNEPQNGQTDSFVAVTDLTVTLLSAAAGCHFPLFAGHDLLLSVAMGCFLIYCS
jgi:hypothetical protein